MFVEFLIFLSESQGTSLVTGIFKDSFTNAHHATMVAAVPANTPEQAVLICWLLFYGVPTWVRAFEISRYNFFFAKSITGLGASE